MEAGRVRHMQIAAERGTRPGTTFYHINDGWHYHVNRRQGDIHYFKCVSFEAHGCPGRAVFDLEDGFRHTQAHNHPADLIYPEEMALRNAILDRCRRLEYLPYRTIIDEEHRRFSPEAVARVTYPRMRTPMRNARMSRFPFPPQNLRELTNILMDPHNQVITLTDDGNDNIYAASVDDVTGGHHVLFMSARQRDLITQFRVLHSDGTFATVPVNAQFAAQVFNIVGVWTDNIIVLATVLMSSRTELAYSAVLTLIRHLCGPNWDLVRAISDFETAEQNAWAHVFNCVVQGCLWHYSRNLLDNAAELDLIRAIRMIPEVRNIVRMTMVLGLLPDQDQNSYIVRGYRIVLQHARDEGNFIFRRVQPFLAYVWRHWVSRPWMRRRMCVYGSLQRSNNVCESTNSVLYQLVRDHPNIYYFIRGIVILEQRSYNATLALDRARNPHRARKRTSILNDNRIANLTRQLLNPPGAVDRTIFRFLREASGLVDNMIDEAIRAGRRNPQ